MNDFDIWQKALQKIDLTEAAAPIYKGRLLLEDTQVEMYNKIQKMLNSNGMEEAHGWLYDLDPTQLSETECCKIDKLFDLAQKRGFIEPDVEEEPEVAEEPEIVEPPQPVVPFVQKKFPTTAFTIVWSATRDGDIKTGEAYSNAISTRAAKADVMNKLEIAGYQNVDILAIECSDVDKCGLDDIKCNQDPETDIPDYSEEMTDEADIREPLGHAFHPQGYNASTANLKKNDCVQMTMLEKDPDEDSTDSDDDSADDSEKEDSDDTEKEDSSDKETEDTEKEDKKEDSEEDSEEKDTDKKEEDAKEPDEKLSDDSDEKSEDAEKEDSEDGKELSAAEKESLRDSYKKAFKAAMQKCKFLDKSFDDLTLQEKVKFFETLDKAWGEKADPSKFMDDKETEQLEKIVVKK